MTTVERPTRPTPGAWVVVGVLGEILITVGVLLLLLVAYQLWWTDVQASRATERTAAELEQAWAAPLPAGTGRTGAQGGRTVADDPLPGTAFARMYIPRLGDRVWGTPVVEGVTAVDLTRGIGHYPSTAMPGEVGNVAVAAHRATNGEPFRDIDRLRAGDEVYVETRDTWYVYTLERDGILRPTDTWAIAAVPGDPDARPTQRLITLTTCHPRWASDQRWIWWGSLSRTLDKATHPVPASLEAGG